MSVTPHPGPLASLPLASPLRQVNAVAAAGPLPTKFGSLWQHLTTNPTLFAGQTPATTQRFFQDLFCLRVNAHVLVDALDELGLDELLGKYRVSDLTRGARTHSRRSWIAHLRPIRRTT